MGNTIETGMRLDKGAEVETDLRGARVSKRGDMIKVNYLKFSKNYKNILCFKSWMFEKINNIGIANCCQFFPKEFQRRPKLIN